MHDVPDGFLRATFQYSGVQTTAGKYLRNGIATIIKASFALEGRSRTGLQGDKNAGKSKFASDAFNAIGFERIVGLLSGNWSTLYTLNVHAGILHYDAKAIKEITANTRMIKQFPAESYHDHLKARARTENAHVVEWPKEDTNKDFSMLLTFSRIVDDTQSIEFYCNNEIATLDNTQQFLDDAKEAGLLLNRE